MQYKQIMLLLGALFCFNALGAQTTSYEDVVHLKNGSVIHGIIIEQVPNVSIKIKSGENIFVYKMDEIEKITKDIVLSDSGGGGGDGGKQKGYAGNYEIGGSFYPRTGDNLSMFSVNIVNGYRFNPYVSLGLGVGAEISTKSTFNFPVYADMRVYLMKNRWAPFIDFATGYNVMLIKSEYYYYYSSSTNAYHGYMISPAFGVCFAVNEKIGVTFSIGYKLIGYKVSDDYYYYTDSKIESLHGVLLRWGINL